ncbi:MAG TPA: helix-turn-helix transcriptional regulator [Clostridiaceae bacterium]|nr:helix-turn-helix transcriptional regulator [Clostridiaceae bacterium]
MTDDEQRQLEVIGYNLSRLLKQNNTTQRELANAVKVSESAVGKWVLGRNAPTMGSVQKIANYFGVRMSDILEIKSPHTDDISEHIERTVETMKQMTAQGQSRVADYAEDLHDSGNYNRQPKVIAFQEEPEDKPEILMAAYDGEELTDEEQAEALQAREDFWKKQEKRKRDTND